MTDVTIDFDGEELASQWYPVDGVARPAVLIFPTVMGVSDLEREFAKALNALGYGAMIGDLFGTSTRGAPRDRMFAELGRLKGDRAALRRRVEALFAAMVAQPGVDASRVAVIGYCFGGLCALDLARAGARLARRRASTACSTRPACRRTRLAARSSPITAGTTRWSRPTRSSH